MSAARHPNDPDGPSAAPPHHRRTRAEPLVASYRPLPPQRDDAPRRRGRLRAYRPLVYLAPVLLTLTFLTVVDFARTPQDSRASTAGEQIANEGPTPAMSNPDGPTVQADGAPTNPARTAVSAELPGGGPFPTQGAGTFHVVPGTSEQIGQGRLSTYTVEVENDIVFTDGDTAFGTVVQATLSHPKSWTATGSTALRRIDTGTPELRVTLASQATARRLCGFDIPYDTSCFLRAKPGHVVLNAARWERGAQSFQGDIGQYRRYVVNHEVGHYFNNPHQPCAGAGALAPLMMQQTLTTANDELSTLVSDIQNDIAVPRDGKVCKPNEWVFPNR
ncbi:DUF3152 domain-containing protein [Lentzea sp. HUAS TT2]|uniref:DUF3152 domain-containing protein n=1 Tax=Lentzea sp. HUAS TT2 TaxID=3447454 RepID=UPI003F6F2654